MDADESCLENYEQDALTEQITKIQASIRGSLVRREMAEIHRLYEEIVKDIEGDDTEVEWPRTRMGHPSLRKVTRKSWAESNKGPVVETRYSKYGTASRCDTSRQIIQQKGEDNSYAHSIEEELPKKFIDNSVGDKLRFVNVEQSSSEINISKDSGQQSVSRNVEDCDKSSRLRHEGKDRLFISEMDVINVLDNASSENVIGIDDHKINAVSRNGASCLLQSNFDGNKTLPDSVLKVAASEEEAYVSRGPTSDWDPCTQPKLVCAEVQTSFSDNNFESVLKHHNDEEPQCADTNINFESATNSVTSNTDSQKSLDASEMRVSDEVDNLNKASSELPQNGDEVVSDKTEKSVEEQILHQSDDQVISHDDCERKGGDWEKFSNQDDTEVLPTDREGLLQLKDSVLMELLWVQQAIVSRKNYLRMRQEV